MKKHTLRIKHYALSIIFIALPLLAMAQPQARRNQQQQQQKSSSNTMSTRAQISFPTAQTMDADVVWRRDVYRELNLAEDANAGLYYPTQPQGSQMNLFTYMFKLMMSGQIKAYDEPVAIELVKFSSEDDKTPIIRDNNKCILCRRCVAVCKKTQGIGVIGANDRGFDTHIASAFESKLADNRGFDTSIGTAMDMPLAETSCINCGQCIVNCPVGALYERDDTDKVLAALADPTKHVLICTAPSVRAQIGECFGYEPGTDCEGKMVAAIKAATTMTIITIMRRITL